MKAEQVKEICREFAKVKDLLDDEIFSCNKCGGEFDHTQGTWLPIGIEKKKAITDTGVRYPSVLIMDLRPPEIITSNEFTCYECTN